MGKKYMLMMIGLIIWAATLPTITYGSATASSEPWPSSPYFPNGFNADINRSWLSQDNCVVSYESVYQKKWPGTVRTEISVYKDGYFVGGEYDYRTKGTISNVKPIKGSFWEMKVLHERFYYDYNRLGSDYRIYDQDYSYASMVGNCTIEDEGTGNISLAAPKDFIADKPSETQINLFWNGVVGTQTGIKYILMLDEQFLAEVSHVQTAGWSGRYSATGLKPDTMYTFKLYAIDSAGNKSESIMLTTKTNKDYPVTVKIDYPVMTSGITLTKESNDSVIISWMPATDNTAVAGYQIYTNSQSAPIAYVTAPATQYTLSNLKDNILYEIQVTAVDVAGHNSFNDKTAKKRITYYYKGVKTYHYDSNGRLESVSFVGTKERIYYVYDTNGNLLTSQLR